LSLDRSDHPNLSGFVRTLVNIIYALDSDVQSIGPNQALQEIYHLPEDLR
jgi:hypothetical protein